MDGQKDNEEEHLQMASTYRNWSRARSEQFAERVIDPRLGSRRDP
jgi:hypothetical protein